MKNNSVDGQWYISDGTFWMLSWCERSRLSQSRRGTTSPYSACKRFSSTWALVKSSLHTLSANFTFTGSSDSSTAVTRKEKKTPVSFHVPWLGVVIYNSHEIKCNSKHQIFIYDIHCMERPHLYKGSLLLHPSYNWEFENLNRRYECSAKPFSLTFRGNK